MLKSIILSLMLVTNSLAASYAVHGNPMPYSSNGWVGYNTRIIIKANRVLTSGNTISLGLQGGDYGFTADMFVGHVPPNSIHAWDMENPVHLSQNGSCFITAPPGTLISTDWVPFNLHSGRDLVVSAYFTQGGSMGRDLIIDPTKNAFYYGQIQGEGGYLSPIGFAIGTPDGEMVSSILTDGDVGSDTPVDTTGRPSSQDCLSGYIPNNPPFAQYQFWQTTNLVHQRKQPALIKLGGSIPVFGDSFIEECVVSTWSPFCENYGIGGDTTAGLMARLPTYTSLRRAHAAIVMIGVNDISVDNPNMAQIEANTMNILNWFTGPLIWCTIPPTSNLTWNQNIISYNNYIKSQLIGRPNCQIVDVYQQLVNSSGYMNPAYTIDVEHLNGAGQEILGAAIRNALNLIP